MVWALYARPLRGYVAPDRSHAAELRWYSFCFTNVLLFVFTRGNRIVKAAFTSSGGRAAWKLTSSSVIPCHTDESSLPVRAEYRYESRTTFRQNAVHGVFTDNSTQGLSVA